MTFNTTSIRLSITYLILTLLAITDSVHGFGARHNYHSYHHISQSSQGQSSKSSSTTTGTSSTQDETERLLERAAHIRQLLEQLASESESSSASGNTNMAES